MDPPLGLAQAAGCLSHHGHEVSVFDLNIELARSQPKGYESLWNWEQFQFWNQPDTVRAFFRDNSKPIESQLERVLRTDAGLIGFSVYSGSQLASLEFARLVKKADPSRKIVFGGQYLFIPKNADGIIRDPAVDGVLCGPAEETLPELAALLEATGGIPVLPGMKAKEGGRVVDGGPSQPLRDLDQVPFADFCGLPLELYDVQDRLPIQASRGCVWNCRFCSCPPFWKGYASMSGDRIWAEIEHQRKLFPGKKHFEFFDLTANGDVRALSRLADLAIEDLRVHGPQNYFGWKINAILRPEMTPDLLDRLMKAGCHDIIYGVESGSPRVRKLMNKPFTDEVADRVLADTQAAGILTVGNFMFGFPGETEADFQQTLEFLRRNQGSFDRVYGSATFTSLEEGSYLAAHRKEFGVREDGEVFHNLYWESVDGTNDYPVRLDRYQRFLKLAVELGLDPYKGIGGSLEGDRFANLAQFYRYQGDHVAAVRNLLEYLKLDPESRPMREELGRYASDIQRIAGAHQGGTNGPVDGLRDRATLRRTADGAFVKWDRSAELRVEEFLAMMRG